MPNGKEAIPAAGLPTEIVQKMAGYVATSLLEAGRAEQIARVLPGFRRDVRRREATAARERAIGVSEVLDALTPQDEPWLNLVKNSLRATEPR